LRIYHLDYQSLWRDEVDAIRFSLSPLPDLFSNFIRPGWNGPLYFLLLRYWIALTGKSEFAIRFFSLLFGILTVPLVYALGRKLLSWQIGIFASILVAFSPYLVWYSQEAKMYALITFSTSLSVYLYLRALDEGGWRFWLGYVVATSFCFYSHLLTALIIPFEIVLFFLLWHRYRVRLRSWLLSIGLLTLPYLPIAIWEIPLFLSAFQTGHRFYPLGVILSILFLAFSSGIIGPWGPLPLALFVFLLLAGVFLRGKGWEGVFVLLLYLFIPILVLYLISLRVPIFTDRYLIFLAPAFYLLLSRGLSEVGRRSKAVLALCLAALLALNVQSIWVQSNTTIKSDFRAAARFFEERSGPKDLMIFLIPYVRHTFEYYYRDDYPWADAPFTNYGMSEGEVGAILSKMMADYEGVWLLTSEAELWDERGLVKGWLDKNAELVEEAEFVRVALYRYLLKGN
jgi:uncharacterized membrane protein